MGCVRVVAQAQPAAGRRAQTCLPTGCASAVNCRRPCPSQPPALCPPNHLSASNCLHRPPCSPFTSPQIKILSALANAPQEINGQLLRNNVIGLREIVRSGSHKANNYKGSIYMVRCWAVA